MVVARRFLPGDGGHRPLDGIGGGIPALAAAPGIALAAVGTLSFGAVLGPEAPLIALGSVVGLAVTLVVRLGDRDRSMVATAGSLAAISALFGGPVVAGVMMVEAGLGLGAGVIPVLLPGFVAAAVGYVLFVGLGSWGGLHAQAIAVPGLPPTRVRICATSPLPSSSAASPRSWCTWCGRPPQGWLGAACPGAGCPCCSLPAVSSSASSP
jgi:hypothetical protein